MEAELFLNHPNTQFERPIRSRSASPKRLQTTPDQDLLEYDADGRFNDFIPLEQVTSQLSLDQVNASLQKTLESASGNAADLHQHLSSDQTFQTMLRNLDARLIFSPDGQNLRVEANGRAASRGNASILEWWPLRPSNLPPYIPPTPTPPEPQTTPPVIFAPPLPPSTTPVYVPTIAATESFLEKIELGTFGMQVVLFFQQEIIQFADLIAGNLDYATPDAILKSGFEDVIRLANKLEQSNQQFVASFKDAGTPASTGQAVNYTISGESLVALSPADRQAAERLRALTKELQNPNQALSIYREERLREGRERNIQLEWYSLPVKLQTLYFASNVSAAINFCLDVVAKNTRGLNRDTLLDTIIRSDARDPFAALVANYVRKNRVHTPNSYHTGIQYDTFNSLYHDSLRELSRCTFKPTKVPPFIKMLRLG